MPYFIYVQVVVHRFYKSGLTSMKLFRTLLLPILILMSFVMSIRAQDVVISEITSTPVTCGGGSDGTMTVSITGGNSPFSYL
jgi:hypothetical protein